MGLQPSASKTALLLACQRPFDPEVATDQTLATEPMRYGSAFHQVQSLLLLKALKKPEGTLYTAAVEEAAEKFDVKPHTRELVEHVRAYHTFLSAWLVKHGWTRVVDVETSFAVNPTDLYVHRISGPSEDAHHYDDLRVGEIAGTVDLVAEDAGGLRVLVLDHKTGFVDAGFAEPARIPQMKTLGLTVNAAEYKSVELAIGHADRQGLPNIHSDTYEPGDAGAHRKALSLTLSRIGDGSLRPGEQCVRCPAETTCPARAAELLEGAREALATLTVGYETTSNSNGSAELAEGVRDGRLYALLRQFRKLDEAATAEIKRKIKAGVLIELPSGEPLTLQTQTYETLSKASIMRALGKLEGERLIASLRKRGVVEKATREMIHAEKAR